jgi:2-polyprenyl-3-methyl-5-hydroxy-6-metoxy-1,4-benzoquinol methylase
MMKQTAPTDIYNQDLYNLIPDNLTSIIEIGSGSGALAKAIKLRSPNMQYIGVEIVNEYAILSERYCDKVLIDNIEKPNLELISLLQNASAIVFSDVLEHLYNPWQTLQSLRTLIPKDCSIYASIPNIQHWSIIFGLISGNFNYADSGLLDRTHLRFFTKKTIMSLFNQSGFEVSSISPRIFNFPDQEKYLSLIKQVAEQMQIDATKSVVESAAFQYTVHAVPHP